MEKKHLWKVLSKLQKASKRNKKSERINFLESCTDDEIHAICGACKNLLDNNIQMTNKKKAYLKMMYIPCQKSM